LIVVPGFISIVDFTIALNHQLRFATEEVCDIITELMLPPEFEAE